MKKVLEAKMAKFEVHHARVEEVFLEMVRKDQEFMEKTVGIPINIIGWERSGVYGENGRDS
jgi:hypothetical protein